VGGNTATHYTTLQQQHLASQCHALQHAAAHLLYWLQILFEKEDIKGVNWQSQREREKESERARKSERAKESLGESEEMTEREYERE